jgi:site-specific DNA recombinase
MMEIAVYARVSTERQQQMQTIQVQLDRLQTYVGAQTDWHLTQAHIYLDEGYSGATLNRPGLDRLRDAAALAEFGLVLVTTPDRLARKLAHQALIHEEMQRLGCQVVYLDRPMGDDPHDQLLLQIRGAVAEYERTLITERMRRGRYAKMRHGELLPWSIAPYAFVPDPEAPRHPAGLGIDPVKAAVVQQIFAWYTDPGQPASLRWVTQQLNRQGLPNPKGQTPWCEASVRNILTNSAYAGAARYDPARNQPSPKRRWALGPWGHKRRHSEAPLPEAITVAVPVIVSPEVFEMAQQRMQRNQELARRHNTHYAYLLRGLVSCGRCRLAATARTTHVSYDYYACTGRQQPERTPAGQACTSPYVPASALDTLVWNDLCQILCDPGLITQALVRAQAGEWLPQTLHARRKTLQHNLAQLTRQQQRLLDAYLAEVISQDEFTRKRQELAATDRGLNEQLRQIQAQATQQLAAARFVPGIEAFCQRVQPTLAQLSFAQRRQLVELLIDRVIVDGTAVEIRYAIPTTLESAKLPFAICD